MIVNTHTHTKGIRTMRIWTAVMIMVCFLNDGWCKPISFLFKMNGFGQRGRQFDKTIYCMLWVSSRKKKTEIPEVLFLKTKINWWKWQGQNVSRDLPLGNPQNFWWNFAIIESCWNLIHETYDFSTEFKFLKAHYILSSNYTFGK